MANNRMLIRCTACGKCKSFAKWYPASPYFMQAHDFDDFTERHWKAHVDKDGFDEEHPFVMGYEDTIGDPIVYE